LKNLKHVYVYGLIHYLQHFETFRKGGNIILCHENKLTPAGEEQCQPKRLDCSMVAGIYENWQLEGVGSASITIGCSQNL
jgi:hypothetical protein